MKKLTILTIVVLSLLVTMSLVAAAPGEGDVDNVTIRGEYNFTGTNNVNVESGNITYVDLSTNFSTYRWAGILGNVNGNIILGDGNNGDILFTWTAKGRVVYATTAANIVWADLVANSNGTHAADIRSQVATDFPHLAGGSDDSDSLLNTFDVDNGTVDSGLYDLQNVPRATTLGGTGWYTYALHDGANVIFAGNVNSTGDTPYDGGADVNYQMIVPEDGTMDDATATQYNLWVELQ